MCSSNFHSFAPFDQAMLEDDYREGLWELYFKCNAVVLLLLYSEGTPTKGGTGNLCRPAEDPDGSLQRTLHNQILVFKEGSDYISINRSQNVDRISFRLYQYTFITINETFELLYASTWVTNMPVTVKALSKWASKRWIPTCQEPESFYRLLMVLVRPEWTLGRPHCFALSICKHSENWAPACCLFRNHRWPASAPRRFDTKHTSVLKAYSLHHGLDYSTALIMATVVLFIDEHFSAIYIVHTKIVGWSCLPTFRSDLQTASPG